MEMEASKGTVFSAAFQPFRRRFAPPGTLWTTSSSGARSCCAWTEQKWVVAGPGERYAQHHWTRPAKYNASVLQKKTTTSSSWIFLVDFLLNTYIYTPLYPSPVGESEVFVSVGLVAVPFGIQCALPLPTQSMALDGGASWNPGVCSLDSVGSLEWNKKMTPAAVVRKWGTHKIQWLLINFPIRMARNKLGYAPFSDTPLETLIF